MDEVKRADECGGKCEDTECAYCKNGICTDAPENPHSWCHGIMDMWSDADLDAHIARYGKTGEAAVAAAKKIKAERESRRKR